MDNAKQTSQMIERANEMIISWAEKSPLYENPEEAILEALRNFVYIKGIRI